VSAGSDLRNDTLKPPRLGPDGRVRFVSPASTPERDKVARGAEILTGWSLTVEMGVHACDRMGHFLAGRDEDRLADMNEALRDPGVRAVFSTTGFVAETPCVFGALSLRNRQTFRNCRIGVPVRAGIAFATALTSTSSQYSGAQQPA
jgi:hypothetical protein